MAVITLTDQMALQIAAWQLGQQRFDITEQSDGNGHSATRLGAPPRWRLRMGSVPALVAADAARWKGAALGLRGRINHLAMWDITSPAPRGTARGSMTLASTAAAGATAVNISGARASNNLLLAGSALGAAAWTLSGATVTANTHVAPDGTTTADTLTDSSAVAARYDRQTISVPDDGTLYQFSCHVLKTTGGTAPTFVMVLEFQGGGTPASSYVRLNTDTGAVLFGSGTVTDAGAYWLFRATLANNATGHTSAHFYLFPAWAPYGVSTQDLTTTGSAVVWGCNVWPAASASSYTPATLLAGDMLQIGTGVGSHYCMVTADAIAENDAGQLVVSIEPPLRQAISSGAAVTWDKPVAHYKLTGDSQAWQGVPGSSDVGGFAFDLLEDWRA